MPSSSVQGGPEKIPPKTIDSFVVNSVFCEPPCTYKTEIKIYTFYDEKIYLLYKLCY